ncbi:MAG: glutamate racemase, partial [Acidobacteriota bacterium]
MKIGVFDSGFGGLTVFKSLQERLPRYDYLYLGDNARAPYGSRSFDAIYSFTVEAVHYLLAQDCRLVIIACNTASAKALRNIQQKILPFTYPERRVLGVIRPSVEEMGRYTVSNQVALWGTEGTIKSLSFVMELEKFAPQVELVQQACPMLVPLVEAGELDGPGAEYFVDKYWEETKRNSNGIDTLLLACTHYPLLYPTIRSIIPERVQVLKQGEIVARSLEDYLQRHPEIDQDLSRSSQARFLTTDRHQDFDRLARIFLGCPVTSERVNLR